MYPNMQGSGAYFHTLNYNPTGDNRKTHLHIEGDTNQANNQGDDRGQLSDNKAGMQ